MRDIQNYAGTTVLDHVDFDAFGSIISETQPSNGDIYKYAGYVQDQASQMYQVGRRWYSPMTGRWTSRDPLGFIAGDPNLYRYVGNDTMNAIDPTGQITYIIHGIRDDGTTWYGVISDYLQGYWADMGYPYNQQVAVPVDYAGFVRKWVMKLQAWHLIPTFQIIQKTSLFAVTFNIKIPTLSVDLEVDELVDRIQMYRADHPLEPVNIVAHSNGTVIALLAAKRVQVDKLILIASPLDFRDGLNRVFNYNYVEDLLKKHPDLEIWNYYTRYDGVTHPIGGGRSWGISNQRFHDVDMWLMLPAPPGNKADGKIHGLVVDKPNEFWWWMMIARDTAVKMPQPKKQ